MKTICLSMIVKNESKIIGRMLASVLPVIDEFCIVDTGSTDDTEAVIHAFAAQHGIKGAEVHDLFVNFEVSRTRALVEARKRGCDYILLMDADMVLEVNGFNKDALTHGMYRLYQGSVQLQYLNARLVSSKLECCYKGVTHEYLAIEPGHTSANLTTLRINDLGDGGSKADKFVRDIRLLTQGIVAEPKNERYYFYLANSYYDSGNPVQAVELYLRRVEMGGWSEEVFYSLFRISLAYKLLKKMDLFLLYGIKAWQAAPNRAESIYELVKYYREEGNQKLAYSFYLLVKDLPPPPDGLFVHVDVYRYKLAYEGSILAYYCGLRKEAFRLYRPLFETPELDLHHLLGNYKFYAPHPAPFKTLDLSCAHGPFTGSSPSIVASEGGYTVNVRLVNYTVNNGVYEVPQNELETRNKKVRVGADFCVVSTEMMDTVDERRKPNDHGCTWLGVEDVKVAAVGNDLFFTGTKCLAAQSIGVCWGTYANPLVPVELAPKQACEKNWVFVPGRLDMVYSWCPLKFGAIQDGGLALREERPMPRLFKMARGSSNGVEFKGEFWFAVHFVYNDGKRFYFHALAVFDREMNLRRYTLPFKFRESAVEYCLGLVVEEERVVFTHSENDASPQLCAYLHSEFEFVKI